MSEKPVGSFRVLDGSGHTDVAVSERQAKAMALLEKGYAVWETAQQAGKPAELVTQVAQGVIIDPAKDYLAFPVISGG